MKIPLSPALISASLLAIGLLNSSFVVANETPTFEINLTGNTLDENIIQLSQQTGLNISIAGSLSKTFNIAAINGQLSAEQALSALLKGTHLSFSPTQAGYVIHRKDQPLPAQLPDVLVNEVETISVSGNRLMATTGSTGLKLTVKQTPQAMSLIDISMIKDFQLEDVGDALALTTGIYATENIGNNNRTFFSRGFRVNDYLNDGIPSVGAVFQQAQLDSAIYQSMEIVRGANGIMQGTGEASASVNLLRKRPLDYFTTQVSATAGSWNDRRLESDVNIPLSETNDLYSRFVVVKQDRDSFADLENEDKRVLYGIVQKTLEDGYISLSLHQEKNLAKSAYEGVPHSFMDGSAINLPIKTNFAAPWAERDQDYKSVYLDTDYQFNEHWALRASFNHAQGTSSDLGSFAAGFPEKNSGIGMIGGATRYDSDSQINNLDVRISGDIELFNLPTQVVAAFSDSKLKENFELFFTGPMNGPVMLGSIYEPNPFADYKPKFSDSEKGGTIIELRSATLSSRIEFTDQLSSVIGVKFNNYQFTSKQAGVFNSSDYVNQKSESLSRANPYMGLVYDFTDDVTAYASLTDIFSPQRNRRDKDNNPVKPEVGSNYEIGLKSEFFNDRFTATLALFNLDQDNVAETDYRYRLPDGRFAVQLMDNITSRGFEVETVGHVTDNLQLNFGYSRFSMQDPNDIDLNTNLPRELLKFQTRYDVSEYVDGLNVGFSVDWRDGHVTRHIDFQAMQDLMSGKVQGEPGIDIGRKGYGLVNLFLNYELNQHWSASLAVNNLNDKHYVSAYQFDTHRFGAPRSFRLRIDYNF